jgi:hypothetical protein
LVEGNDSAVGQNRRIARWNSILQSSKQLEVAAALGLTKAATSKRYVRAMLRLKVAIAQAPGLVNSSTRRRLLARQVCPMRGRYGNGWAIFASCASWVA